MSGEGAENIMQNTLAWENELWSYLSNGDGTSCPLREACKVKRSCGWCFDDHAQEIGALYGIGTFSADENEIDVDHRLIKRAFPEHWIAGRIFQLVEMLATKYLEKTGTTRPPVPTELIRCFDVSPSIEVRLLPLKAYHGAVWHLEDGWVIYLNTNDTPYRQRLALFHEVFHILAHSKATPVFRKRGISHGFFNEMLADYFAGCILMPKEWVKGKWAEVNDLRQMAKIFHVTELAMWIRLRTEGLI